MSEGGGGGGVGSHLKQSWIPLLTRTCIHTKKGKLECVYMAFYIYLHLTEQKFKSSLNEKRNRVQIQGCDVQYTCTCRPIGRQSRNTEEGKKEANFHCIGTEVEMYTND